MIISMQGNDINSLVAFISAVFFPSSSSNKKYAICIRFIHIIECQMPICKSYNQFLQFSRRNMNAKGERSCHKAQVIKWRGKSKKKICEMISYVSGFQLICHSFIHSFHNVMHFILNYFRMIMGPIICA